MIFSDSALQNQRIECLLHLKGACVQFIQKQAERFFLNQTAGRAEDTCAVHDLRHSDQILRGKLASCQADAGQAQLCGKLLYNRGLPDSGCTPDKNGPDKPDLQKKLLELILVDRNR